MNKKCLNPHKTTLLEWLTCFFKGHKMGDLYSLYEYNGFYIREPGCIRCGKVINTNG